MGNLWIHLVPYFGYTISGKIKNKATLNEKTERETKNIKFGNGDGYDYKPLDFGSGTGFSLGDEKS